MPYVIKRRLQWLLILCLWLLPALLCLRAYRPLLPPTYTGLAGFPNDPALQQGSLTYAPQLLNLFTAWDFPVVTTDVVVAVLDTGIAHHHPEFAGRILPGYDFINDDDDPEDDRGHGTHIAGIAAAAVDNGAGVVGVCGFCQILPIKIVTADGHYSPAGIKAGLVYAADHGADIALISLGQPIGSSSIVEGIDYARQHGLFIVAAAGNNDSSTPFYPAAYEGVFAVTATTRGDQRWYRSNFGSYVDVAAPGDDIYSTYHELNHADGGYLSMSGTSMAAPFVAGLAGLLLAQNPARTADELAELIRRTAIDLGAPGRDDFFGYGRIDPVAALQEGALNPPAIKTLSGAVWYDNNHNGVREPGEQIGVPWVQIRLQDNQQRIVGLTNTRLNGEWRWAAPVGVTYLVRPHLPYTMVITSANQLTVTVTPSLSLAALDFGVLSLPTAADLQTFAAIRHHNQILLSWTVTPLVRTIAVERATSSGRGYTMVGSLDIDNPNAAALSINFIDMLPPEVQDETILYRVQLLPGEVVVGPYLVAAEGAPNLLFLPMITR
jgi:hypothetical protein